MKTFKALLQREYWEHRGAFMKTPIIMGIVSGISLILLYLTTEQIDLRLNSGQLAELGAQSVAGFDPKDIQFGIDVMMLASASIYHFVLFVILFFYLLGSLYDDRKDGSILFWKSLPVSDTQTVLSKLVTVMIVAPIIFTFGLIISQLIFFILMSIILLTYGINPFTFMWVNINFVTNWGAFFIGCMVQALWALPIYSWLLVSSSLSKRRPFLLAVFGPLTLWFAWYWYNALTNLDVLQVGLVKSILFALAKAASPFTSGITFSVENFGGFDPTEQTGIEVINSMLGGLTEKSLLYGITFAVVAVALAIYIRRFRNTT